MGFRWTDTEGVETATNFLHNDSGPLACRLRTLLEEKGIDPKSAVLATCFSDDPSFEFGIVVASDKRVFQFGFDYLHRDVAEGAFSEWAELTEGFQSSPHERRIRAALARLSKERGAV